MPQPLLPARAGEPSPWRSCSVVGLHDPKILLGGGDVVLLAAEIRLGRRQDRGELCRVVVQSVEVRCDRPQVQVDVAFGGLDPLRGSFGGGRAGRLGGSRETRSGPGWSALGHPPGHDHEMASNSRLPDRLDHALEEERGHREDECHRHAPE